MPWARFPGPPKALGRGRVFPLLGDIPIDRREAVSYVTAPAEEGWWTHFALPNLIGNGTLRRRRGSYLPSS